MLSREKLLEEERLDETIESLFNKITQAILAFNMRNADSEEAKKLISIQPKVLEFKRMYKREYDEFKKDEEMSEEKIKAIEQKLIEELGMIIIEMTKYGEDIHKMIEEAGQGKSIRNELDDLIQIHNKYVAESEKLKRGIEILRKTGS